MKLKPVLAQQAKARQLATLKQNTVQQNSAGRTDQTRDTIARAAGVSHDTISKVEAIERRAPEPVKQQLRAGEQVANLRRRGSRHRVADKDTDTTDNRRKAL